MLFHDGELKISDFGLARFANADMMMTTCGTPGYVAPEILKGKGYGKAVDFWSIGVILYILLCGFPPFYDDDNFALFEKIKKGQFDFPSPSWDNVSSEAKEIIKLLLRVKPEERLNPEELLEKPWIKGESKVGTDNVLEKMRDWNSKRRLKVPG